ncbi:methyltransferase [Runella sp.]|jgi:tRNA1Val (adenine37-N6)-methyltransferase|uniref:tRNA1(Val) (adenine(37)-N6)-methyltransferase n=1 Tax=Runella sp. TaxID=1960881 RepID=UPI00301937B7
MPRIPAPFFRFKQFAVWHDRSALRVCTEACILGAYAEVTDVTHALDIGTGTGLLALMIAQRNAKMQIDAVEIEAQNVEQAIENVIQSPFLKRISVVQAAIQNWRKPESPHSSKYDLIISNPPFFDKHLLSPREERNRALHTETLSLSDLALSVARLLADTGRFVVLLPPFETQRLIDFLTPLELHPTRQLHIFSRQGKPVFRKITTFERKKKEYFTETLYIHDNDGKYSDDFRTLLKEYYLIF